MNRKVYAYSTIESMANKIVSFQEPINIAGNVKFALNNKTNIAETQKNKNGGRKERPL